MCQEREENNIMYKLTSAYKCDTCNRTIKFLRNNNGLILTQQCTITENCNGTLYPILNPQEAIETNFSSRPVQRLTDWFQQPLLHNHIQSISTNVWNITHNLLTFPYVDVLINRLDSEGNTILTEVPPSDYEVEIIDTSSLRILFRNNESGLAQCVARMTENTINPEITIQETPRDVQITNNSTITIATSDDSSSISFEINYIVNNTKINIRYINIDDQPSINSPWVDARRVFIDGKTFTVRSFNFVTQPLATNFFTEKRITKGARLYFNISSGPKQNYILLANTPFASVDKNKNQIIDIGTISIIQPELYYDNGNIFAFPSIIKPVYPSVYII